MIMPFDISSNWIPSVEAKGCVSRELSLHFFQFLLLFVLVFFYLLLQFLINISSFGNFKRYLCCLAIFPITLPHMKTNEFFIKTNFNCKFIVVIFIILRVDCFSDDIVIVIVESELCNVMIICFCSDFRNSCFAEINGIFWISLFCISRGLILRII